MTTYRETRKNEIYNIMARNNKIKASSDIADLQISKEVELLKEIRIDFIRQAYEIIDQKIKERE